MLRGNAPAKLDTKGRLKVPAHYRRHIDENFGKEFFVTSEGRNSILLYPMSVWETIEKRIDSLPQAHPSLHRYLDVVNYYGSEATMDAQGRILIHPMVREFVGHAEEVCVLGKRRWLEVWNRELLHSRITDLSSGFSEEDRRVLADFGL
jgi:MraZ protein